MKALLLAAGLGTRLQPITYYWPKCLMPIQGRPLLEYWLESLRKLKLEQVWVNGHYKSEAVKGFLDQPQFSDWVSYIEEPKLLGTAGTFRNLSEELQGATVMLVHADNLCQCDLQSFLNSHRNRPSSTLITMMTFRTETPMSCGIVEIDERGIVLELHEKVDDPPGNLANAAVYILEPEIMSWLKQQPDFVSDFTTQVLNCFIGKINTWENTNVHRDIGNQESLIAAQSDPVFNQDFPHSHWQKQFEEHSIHQMLHKL
jgi:mannose-1-phosphate guanylyltransferase